jgi:hypothetical protein
MFNLKHKHMKKIILFIAAIGLFTVHTQAQGVDFGIKAGVNFSDLTKTGELTTRTGFVAGFFVGARGEKVGFQTELLYSQQGGEFDAGKFELDYVNVPLLLKFYLAENFNFQVGPQFGIVVNDDTKTVIGEVVNDIGTNDFDISGVVGLGYELPLGFRVSGRYNFGLNDVPSGTEFKEGNNSVWSFAVGYSFF